jgi:hypothetical protein
MDRFVVDELVGWEDGDTGNQQFVDDESGLWEDGTSSMMYWRCVAPATTPL